MGRNCKFPSAERRVAAICVAALLLTVSGVLPTMPAASGSGVSLPNSAAAASSPTGISAKAEILIGGTAFSAADAGTEVRELEGKAAAVTQEDGYIEWTFNAPESGRYQLQIQYYNVEGKGSTIERELLLDGQPHPQARLLSFSRSWMDETADYPEDDRGNQLRPEQREVQRWNEVWVTDPMGYEPEPLWFELEQGVHVLRLNAVREPMAVARLKFGAAPVPKPYAEYDMEHPKQPGADTLFLEAEAALDKSDFSIFPYSDYLSAFSTPQDPYKIKLNALGGTKWQTAGQWIRWELPEITHAGRYQIMLRGRQNVRSGIAVTRRVYVDGEVPFQEANAVEFPYGGDWVNTVLAGKNGTPYEFYLSEGRHTLTLEVTLGDLADEISTVNSCLLALNGIYREILMITGPSPDLYRDYEFEYSIPETLAAIKAQAEILTGVSDALKSQTGRKGQDTAAVDKMIFDLKEMFENPEEIARRFSGFQADISALGDWVQTARQLPLELDSIRLLPAGSALPKSEKNLGKQLLFSFKSFLASFFTDYNAVGGVGEKKSARKVTVWLATGRDQAQIVKLLADSSLYTEYGISADVQLVSPGTLLPSVLAGTGPDVSLSNACSDPVNYATRKAVVDLSEFPDFAEIRNRFIPGSMTPYEFSGGTFALPETVIFPMMFYRKDIFNELKLSPPKTWTAFYRLIPELQKRNMQIGFPATMTGLQIFLYQNGGSLYNATLTGSGFDSEKALDAFGRLTDLFTMYRFPVRYDFVNRFRTGEMPLVITDYTMYNNLVVYAPEIRGEWEFLPLPANEREDGTVSGVAPIVSVAQTGGTPSTGAMMLKNTKDLNAAWAFLKWWTSDETQSSFSNEMEAVMGVASKQPTANRNALSRLSWTAGEYKALSAQAAVLQGTPEIPGGYYTSRYYDFAFNDVYSSGQLSDRALLKYTKTVNAEINRKRAEFGLSEQP